MPSECVTQAAYEVGFKDVYPWVWSVMLGVALTLADKRNAFMPVGTRSSSEMWTKNLLSVLLTVVLPSVVFGLTMVRLGPKYSSNMDFWQVLGSLYLASTPLGSHHVWVWIARRRGWLVDTFIPSAQPLPRGFGMGSHIAWAVVALLIPASAAIFALRLPW